MEIQKNDEWMDKHGEQYKFEENLACDPVIEYENKDDQWLRIRIGTWMFTCYTERGAIIVNHVFLEDYPKPLEQCFGKIRQIYEKVALKAKDYFGAAYPAIYEFENGIGYAIVEKE